MVDKKIQLTEALEYIGNTNPKPYFYINPGDALGTFFSYKGRLIELNKIKVSAVMDKKKNEEVFDSIRKHIISAAKLGEWLIFHIDKNTGLNVVDYLKTLGIDIPSLCKAENNQKRDYYVKNKLLTDQEDFDNFNNKGCWKPNDKFRIGFLTCCEESEIPELKSNNSEDVFDFIIVA